MFSADIDFTEHIRYNHNVYMYKMSMKCQMTQNFIVRKGKSRDKEMRKVLTTERG